MEINREPETNRLESPNLMGDIKADLLRISQNLHEIKVNSEHNEGESVDLDFEFKQTHLESVSSFIDYYGEGMAPILSFFESSQNIAILKKLSALRHSSAEKIQSDLSEVVKLFLPDLAVVFPENIPFSGDNLSRIFSVSDLKIAAERPPKNPEDERIKLQIKEISENAEEAGAKWTLIISNQLLQSPIELTKNIVHEYIFYWMVSQYYHKETKSDGNQAIKKFPIGPDFLLQDQNRVADMLAFNLLDIEG